MGGVIVVFICIFGAIIWGIRAGKKRRDEMTLLADRLMLNFHHERDYHLADDFSFLEKLRQGSNRYVSNILSGPYGDHDITIFDYRYETHSTDSDGKKDTTHHHFSFFILTLPKPFEELTIASESFSSNIVPAEGFNNIDFENHEFSKKFAVRSKDKKFAYDFCNAQMIEYLLKHPSTSIEVDHNMLAIGYNHCLKVEDIIPHINRLYEIRELMPDHLFDN